MAELTGRKKHFKGPGSIAMDIRKKIETLGYELPEAAAPAANYVPFIIERDTLYIAGQIPFLNGRKMHIGQVGGDLTLEEGREAARACALNILAQADAAVNGDWDRIGRCLKLGGFVHAAPGFSEHSAVINGASDLIGTILGERGKHTRFAVGASSLPFGVAVEIEALFSLQNVAASR